MTSSNLSTYSMDVSGEGLRAYIRMTEKCTSQEPVEEPVASGADSAFHTGLASLLAFLRKLLAHRGLRSMNMSKGSYGGNALGVGLSCKKFKEEKDGISESN